MGHKIRRRVFEILDVGSGGDLTSRIFDIFIMSLIFLNVAAVIIETLDGIPLYYRTILETFNIVSVIIFTIEYLLRIWSCTSVEKFSHPIKGRFFFALTPLALIDLGAVLPFYLPMVTDIDLRFLRSMRLLRVLKLTRYSNSFQILGNVVRAKKGEIFVAVFVVFLFLVLASSLMYFVEHDAQPEAFSSIPHTMWWAVATLSTVGYGDIYPISPLGKVLGAIVALLGIGMFALPAGILASGLVEEVGNKGQDNRLCPHCGKNINDT